MHEFSIVQSLLSLVEEYAKREGAKRVESITVIVGPMSGVEPHLLRLAFDTFKEGTIAEGAQLHLERAPIKVYCEECKSEYEKEELNLLCPVCQKPGRFVGGDELFLKSIEMEV